MGLRMELRMVLRRMGLRIKDLRIKDLRTKYLRAKELGTRNFESKGIQNLLLLAHEIVPVNGDGYAMTVRMLFHA